MKAINITRHKITPCQRKLLREAGITHIQHLPINSLAELRRILHNNPADYVISTGEFRLLKEILDAGKKPLHFIMSRTPSTSSIAMFHYEPIGLEEIRELRYVAKSIL